MSALFVLLQILQS